MALPDLHEHQFEFGSDTCTVPGCTMKVDELHLEDIHAAQVEADQQMGGVESGLVLTSRPITVDEAKLTTLLYLLLRDHLPAGDMEEAALAAAQAEGGDTMTNIFLVGYVDNIIRRLREA